MAEDKQDPDGIVATARKRFQLGMDALGKNRAEALDDLRFFLGDSENLNQWPAETQVRRAVDRQPMLTINTTAQHCNQIINAMRQNRPQATIVPVDDYSDKRTADMMGGLLRSVQSLSNAEDAHDVAMRGAVIGGEGYWRITLEYETPKSFDQAIRVRPVLNPRLVVIDPDCREVDRSDARWGFVFEDISLEQARLDHPLLDAASFEEAPDGWANRDTIRRADYYWCEDVDDEALRMADGTELFLSESEKTEGFNAELIMGRRKTKRKEWRWCRLVGGHDKPVDERIWPGSYLPIVSCIGIEDNVNGEIVRKGLVRDLKDPARILNYSYSAAVEGLALQNKVPYIASAESIEGFEDIWKSANLENRSYLPYNARDEDQELLPRPERQAPPMLPSAFIQLMQISTENMRAASGQQNANFGIRSEASSGIGIQRLKQQGEVATFHFPDNAVRALRYEARIILDLIPKVYTKARIVRVLGLDGEFEEAGLDPKMQQAFVQRRAKVDGQVSKIFNPNVGRYDVRIDVGPSYATQRQEAFTALTELAGKSPALMQIAGDIIMRAADFPMAEQLAERLKKTIPPELMDEDGPEEIPPAVQQHLEQMAMQLEQAQQMLQQQGQALQEAQQALADKAAEIQLKQADVELKRAEVGIKEADLEIKAFDAGTKRIQAQQPPPMPEPDGSGEAQGPEEPEPSLAEAIAPLAMVVEQNAASTQESIAALAAAQQQTDQALLLIAEKIAQPQQRQPVSVSLVRQPDGSLRGVAQSPDQPTVTMSLARQSDGSLKGIAQ